MINRLKNMYIGYDIYIQKKDKLYDLNNNIVAKENIKSIKYIIVNHTSYEVHKKSKK